MNKEQEFYKKNGMQCLSVYTGDENSEITDVLWDRGLITLSWVCQGLKIPENSLRVMMILAFVYQGKWIGSLLFHDGYAAHDVWWTIYTTNPKWCCRRFLKKAFRAAFVDLKCRRIGVLVQENNIKSLKLVKGLGFVLEGKLRSIGEQGESCFVLSLLKEECKFL